MPTATKRRTSKRVVPKEHRRPRCKFFVEWKSNYKKYEGSMLVVAKSSAEAIKKAKSEIGRKAIQIKKLKKFKAIKLASSC